MGKKWPKSPILKGSNSLAKKQTNRKREREREIGERERKRRRQREKIGERER